jgi:hypothetical protein
MSVRKKQRLSRRQFLGSAAGTSLIVGAGAGEYFSLTGEAAAQQRAAATPTGPDATLALTNGRIHTMNAANAIVPSVTIRNGRFVAVGGAAPAAGANTRVIDLREGPLFPVSSKRISTASASRTAPGTIRFLRTRRRFERFRKRLPRVAKMYLQDSGSRLWVVGIRISGRNTVIRR